MSFRKLIGPLDKCIRLISTRSQGQHADFLIRQRAVAIFGNHGGNSGGLRGGKFDVWEGGFRVPAIVLASARYREAR